VLISSTAGQRGEANHADYAVTKGALISLTKSLSSELAPKGIRVNCVAPGWVATEMSAAALDHPELGSKIIAGIPVGARRKRERLPGRSVFVYAAGRLHLRRSAEREWRSGAGGLMPVGLSRPQEEIGEDAESFAVGLDGVAAWPGRSRRRPDAADDAGAKNAKQARAALDAMVQALGGRPGST
jgi:hypothetical protein